MRCRRGANAIYVNYRSMDRTSVATIMKMAFNARTIKALLH